MAFEVPKDWKPMKGGIPLAVALGSMLLYSQLKGSSDRKVGDAHVELGAKRMHEADRNSGTISALRGGAALNPLASMTYAQERADSQNNDYPLAALDLDKSAAEYAREAGRVLAKTASFGPMLSAINKSPNLLVRGAQAVAKPVLSRTPSLGLKSKALLGGAVVGTGLLAAKAGKKAYEFGMEPAQERRQGAPGPRLPRYTNQWGVPTM